MPTLLPSSLHTYFCSQFLTSCIDSERLCRWSLVLESLKGAKCQPWRSPWNGRKAGKLSDHSKYRNLWRPDSYLLKYLIALLHLSKGSQLLWRHFNSPFIYLSKIMSGQHKTDHSAIIITSLLIFIEIWYFASEESLYLFIKANYIAHFQNAIKAITFYVKKKPGFKHKIIPEL